MSFILKKTRVNTDFFELQRRFLNYEDFTKNAIFFMLDDSVKISKENFTNEKNDFDFIKISFYVKYKDTTLKSELLFVMSTFETERCFDIFFITHTKNLENDIKDNISTYMINFLENIRKHYNKNWIIKDSDITHNYLK
ncbi:MAG: hypothetical protein CSB15_00685 [Clostridiales bacterium]|nr:MAG: hypothetical protein CSB15_00685 [Clostridiales bacterium]